VTVLPTLSEINIDEGKVGQEESKRQAASTQQKKVEPKFEAAAKIHEEIIDSDEAGSESTAQTKFTESKA
jgi:hypothetical protein